MAHKLGLGNVINGSFKEGTITLKSKNPSRNFEQVFSTTTDPAHVLLAIDSAKKALSSWAYASPHQKQVFFSQLKACFIKNEAIIAEAISDEMGKIKSEALIEAKSLSARIDLMLDHGATRVKTEVLYDLRAETRYHHQGVLAVIGPFNFPAHLVNAHVIPSLLMGNTVIVKPSEVCPQVGELYAKCFLEAGFPPGVFNMIQGDGSIGKLLCAHPFIDGVLFTGSYPTGRALQELLIDQPHKILALELGGKNFAVVMDDADLEQAVLEIVQGAFLTTGQRCTATSRVLIHENIFAEFSRLLLAITKKIEPDLLKNEGMFGPLATEGALHKFKAGLDRARGEGAEVLLESRFFDGGAFVTPSIYRVKSSHPITGYLSEELFGPNLALETFNSLNQAINRINESPYGLSNAIFSLDHNNCDRLYRETKSGVLNFNRSTNGAYGQMPFGGVNKSGNQRAAGIDAVRYASFPVAITSLAYGDSAATSELKKLFKEISVESVSIEIIRLRHEIEKTFEIFGINTEAAALDRLIYLKRSFGAIDKKSKEFFSGLSEIFGASLVVDQHHLVFHLQLIKNAEQTLRELEVYLEQSAAHIGLSLAHHLPLKINIPSGMHIPRSRAMLDRLYQGHFLPKEKKSPVIDLGRSRGAYLASVDDDPLILFDAASQIATLGAGFNADTFQNAYDTGHFDLNLVENYDLSQEAHDQSELAHDAHQAQLEFENFLHEQSNQVFSSIAFGSSGAEANEIALDLCRQNGPGGTRIIAFEGAFHGRTIMALQATYNKEKRGPFMFKGYEASFVPFPKMDSPDQEPPVDSYFLSQWAKAEIPVFNQADNLLAAEINSLCRVKEEIERGNICAVIIEPMQCEGGDQYASNRFFNALRALTRALKTPLIFDEVQTGFHLGRRFFWHQQFNLRDHQGRPETPDCITLGKKAQLGVCMSVWPNTRSYSPHVIQLKRGLLQGRAINSQIALVMEKKAKKELQRLEEYFPELITNGRACGFAFAFDMPSSNLANDLINQRFERGFMAYIAGERTLRFRLNMTTTDRIINSLFEKIFVALIDMRDGHSFKREISPNALVQKANSPFGNISFVELTKENFDSYVHAVENIENNAYEEGRRDSMATLRGWLHHKDSLGLVLKCHFNGEEMVGGYVIGGPLENTKIDGPNHDPLRKKLHTFYSANVTLDARIRGHGLGTMLKNEQIGRVKGMKNEKGEPRYHFLVGRNRLDLAIVMTHINQQLGAYTVGIYEHQYGKEDATALYYRLPLIKTQHLSQHSTVSEILDCRNSIQQPFRQPPEGLQEDLAKNRLRTIVGTKLTLSNWATPNLVRYSELLRALMPSCLKHTYFTSGRDEVVDKGVRSLRFHRLEADMVIGFSHQWLGTITAAARSLSHDQGQSQPFKWFDWPHIPHPAIVGNHASLTQLSSLLSLVPHEKVLAIVVELMGEKSGANFDAHYLSELEKIRMRTGIPLVFVESTSALGRSGQSLFLTDTLPVKPNMVWWYSGGQLGHVFVDDQYFVEKPLTLISTWDGDDLSIARAYHHLITASKQSRDPLQQFDRDLRALLSPEHHRGQGSWHGIKLPKIGTAKAQALAKERGILFGAGFDDWLMVCPRPDFSPELLQRVLEMVKQLI